MAALLREYKKYIGVKTEDEPVDGIDIKVLGRGCPTCDHLVRELMAVIEETGIDAGLEHVRDQQEISRYVVMGLPAIVINGKVADTGPSMSRARLKELLTKAGR
ncbi:MAG: thioredoxin family protein [Desulfobacterales bacterium]|nr:thioredoxin family protein [Desulfobacterales bacterium]